MPAEAPSAPDARLDEQESGRALRLQLVSLMPLERAAYYAAGLDRECGWLTVNEVRAAEGLPPFDHTRPTF